MRGFAQLYRFTVVEVLPAHFKPRAISLVLAGFFGPVIGSRTLDWLPENLFAGSSGDLLSVCFHRTHTVLDAAAHAW